MGGAATLWIGGISDTEIQIRKGTAERTANVLRGAVSDGALPVGVSRSSRALSCSTRWRPGLPIRTSAQRFGFFRRRWKRRFALCCSTRATNLATCWLG